MFRLIKFLIVVAVLAAAAAFVMKPGPDDAEAHLRSVMLGELERAEAGGNLDPAQMLLLASCKAEPNACYDIARQMIDMRYEDRTLYARVDLKGFDKTATCYGAFGRFFCPGGLKG